MPIDPNIALSVKTPEPISPMQSIGQLMQMRDMSSQIALRNAQTATQQQNAADIAQQTEQRRRDNQSWNKITDMMRDPGNYAKIATGDYSPAYQAGATGTVLSQFIKNQDERRQAAQTLETGKADLYAKQRQMVQDMLEGAHNQKDDGAAVEMYNSGRQNLIGQLSPQLAATLPMLRSGPQSREQLEGMISSNGYLQKILEHAATLESKQSEAALTAQKTTHQKLVNDAIERGNEALQSGGNPIDGIFPAALDPNTNANYKNTYASLAAMPPDENGRRPALEAFLSAAAEHAEARRNEVFKATDPNIRAGEVSKAVATEQATAPIKVATSAAEAANKPTMLMVPGENGGYSLQAVKPGQAVQPGSITAGGMTSMTVPTANTRAMAEKAPRVIQFVDRINQLLDENEKQLGPLESRWAEFTAGKIGVANKGYTQLRTDAGLLQTALMNMHVGARGGGEIMEHFQKLIDTSKQSPTNLRAALGEIKAYAQTVATEGHPGQPAGETGKFPVSTAPVTVKDPRGVVHTFPNQAQADAFKKAAGIQ